MAFTFTFTKTLILFVSLSSLLLHSHAARTPQARVYSLCKTTTNPYVCYKTILPEVEGLARFNNYKALEIEIQATKTQVQTTLDLITSLLAKPGNSKDLSDSLSICQDQYGNILDSIEESTKLVAQRNVGEARFKFSAVMSYHDTCDDQFTRPSPIATQSKAVYDLGGNSLDIMKVIVDRESRRRGGASAGTTPLTGPSTPPSPCQGQVGLCS